MPTETHENQAIHPYREASSGVKRLLPDCLAWNDIQNLPRHIRILSNLLIRHYVQSKGTA